MSTPEKTLYQMIAYIRRAPHVSMDEFYEHWGKTHSTLIAPWAEKYGVKTYKQVRLGSPALQEKH